MSRLNQLEHYRNDKELEDNSVREREGGEYKKLEGQRH